MPTTGRTLSEHESLRLVARHGVPVVAHEVAHDTEHALDAAERIGYPVVVKLHGEAIAHKTERGLVRLAVVDAAGVRAAADSLLAAVRPEDGDVALLVAAMLEGTRELVAGVHTDPQFGRCVMVGIGGVLAEEIADVAFRLVPLAAVDAREMIDDLTHQSLLDPARAEPAVDRNALAQVLLALSALAEQHADVVAVDVNPLVVVDGRPIAVDALVEVVG